MSEFTEEWLMLRKLIGILSLLLVAGALTGVSYANAIQITLGQSTTGPATAGANGASFSGVSGYAYQGTNSGTYWLSDATLTGTGCNFVCALAPNSETLTVTIGVDTLIGTLSLNTEALGAFLNGSLFINSSTSGFASTGYVAGQTTGADLVVVGGHISSGQIETDAVPEPGTIALMGSGLLGLAGFLRRRS
jgi:PEP-CTERM motif